MIVGFERRKGQRNRVRRAIHRPDQPYVVVMMPVFVDAHAKIIIYLALKYCVAQFVAPKLEGSKSWARGAVRIQQPRIAPAPQRKPDVCADRSSWQRHSKW